MSLSNYPYARPTSRRRARCSRPRRPCSLHPVRKKFPCLTCAHDLVRWMSKLRPCGQRWNYGRKSSPNLTHEHPGPWDVGLKHNRTILISCRTPFALVGRWWKSVALTKNVYLCVLLSQFSCGVTKEVIRVSGPLRTTFLDILIHDQK